jgi:hypothetical protein
MLRRSCSVQGSKQLFFPSERRYEKLKSPIFWELDDLCSGVWRCITGKMVPDISKRPSNLICKDRSLEERYFDTRRRSKITRLSRNVGRQLPNDTAPHSERTENAYEFRKENLLQNMYDYRKLLCTVFNYFSIYSVQEPRSPFSVSYSEAKSCKKCHTVSLP